MQCLIRCATIARSASSAVIERSLIGSPTIARGASSSVMERNVRVAAKVQQEEVCSKLQPIRIIWTLDVQRQQRQKKKIRVDGSP
jgi:hypothetical protein